MSDTVILDAQEAIDLFESEENEQYKLYDQAFIGEWRWGFEYQIVIQDKVTERIYAADVKIQSGDNYYLSWQDMGQVVFIEVIRIERIDYSYRRA